jgi:2-dehydropantoate 2-reductase
VTVTVAVLGPGAVGGALAVRLARAGEHVICIARRETADAIAREGLTLVHSGSELRARPRAVEELDERVDVLLVTVKAPELSAALDRVRSDPEFVLPLLNGLEHMELLHTRFARVSAATIGRFEACREGPTRIVQKTGCGVVTIADGEAVPLLQRAGVEVRAGGTEQDVLWEKLARLAPLAALTAATQQPVGELRGDPRLVAGVEEACAVAVADGAHTNPADQWAIIDALPDDLISSAARDVAAGRPSELDAITGAAVRAGRRLGVPTPTLEELLAQCPA